MIGCTSPVDLIDAAKAKMPASSNCFRGWRGVGRTAATAISTAPVVTVAVEAGGRSSRSALGATSASSGNSETEINEDNPRPKRGLAALDVDDMSDSFPWGPTKKFHMELFGVFSLASRKIPAIAPSSYSQTMNLFNKY